MICRPNTLEIGAKHNTVKKSDKMTILHWAAHHGNYGLVDIIIKHELKKLKNSAARMSTGKDGEVVKAKGIKGSILFKIDKDGRYPLDIAGGRFQELWMDADDTMSFSLVAGSNFDRSSIDDFMTVIEKLCDNASLQNLKATKRYLALPVQEQCHRHRRESECSAAGLQ